MAYKLNKEDLEKNLRIMEDNYKINLQNQYAKKLEESLYTHYSNHQESKSPIRFEKIYKFEEVIELLYYVLDQNRNNMYRYKMLERISSNYSIIIFDIKRRLEYIEIKNEEENLLVLYSQMIVKLEEFKPLCHFNLEEEIPEKEDLIKIYNIMKLLE
jgi:DNA replicative helicase MCM subunit Mcm2 (Cdc46/Mcm family)